MSTYAIIGAGNVGSALKRSLVQKKHKVIQFSRKKRTSLGATLKKIPPGTTTFLCVPEIAIEALGPELSQYPLAYVTVSGSAKPDLFFRAGLHEVRTFHPLMGFSEVGPHSFQSVPVAVSDPKLAALARTFGAFPFQLPDNRALYHAAAVMAGAGAMTVWSAATALIKAAGVSEGPRVLLPIALAALNNAAKTSGKEALTGPVRRGDDVTIEAHRSAITQTKPELLPIYDAVIAEMRRLNASA